MSSYPISLRPFGESAILISWPEKVDEAILYDILRFAKSLEEDYLNFAEWEMVPAYNSLTLIHRHRIEDMDRRISELKNLYSQNREKGKLNRVQWRLPVCYDLEFGLDLQEVAETLDCSIEQLIEWHTQQPFTVFGIGFLPGYR